MSAYHSSNVCECEGDVVDYARNGVAIAHCISADCAMGAGIARALDSTFRIREQILALPANLRAVGCVVEVRRPVSEGRTVSIFNLVTKATRNDLPTYDSIRAALSGLRLACDDYDRGGGEGDRRRVDMVAVPRIGCGIDRLEWTRVLPIVVEEFDGCPTEIRVCRLVEAPRPT
jgi:O-acetyl-ADP-ribose deacetylase (regulator of RNase III)